MGRGNERNHISGAMGHPAAKGDAVGMRSQHSLAHPRDRGTPASVLSHVGLEGSGGRRPYGPAHAPRLDQSDCRLISGRMKGRRQIPLPQIAIEVR
jgi:hypothetical protein